MKNEIKLNTDNTISIILLDNTIKWMIRVNNGNFMLPFYSGCGSVNNIQLIYDNEINEVYGEIFVILSNKEIIRKNIYFNIYHNNNIMHKPLTISKINNYKIYTDINKINIYPNKKDFIIHITSLCNDMKCLYNLDYDKNLLEIKNDNDKQVLYCKYIGINTLTTFIKIYNEDSSKLVFITYVENEEEISEFKITKINNLEISEDNFSFFNDITLNPTFKFISGKTYLNDLIPKINYKENIIFDVKSISKNSYCSWFITKTSNNVKCLLNKNQLIIKLINYNFQEDCCIILQNLDGLTLKINFSVDDNLIEKKETIFSIYKTENEYENHISLLTNNIIKLKIKSCVDSIKDSFSIYQNDNVAKFSIQIFKNKKWTNFINNIDYNGNCYIGYTIDKNINFIDGDILISPSVNISYDYTANIILKQNNSNKLFYLSLTKLNGDSETKLQPKLLLSNSNNDKQYNLKILNNKITLSNNDITKGINFEFKVFYRENIDGIISNIYSFDKKNIKVEFRPTFNAFKFIATLEKFTDCGFIVNIKKDFQGTMPFEYLPIGKLYIYLNDNVLFNQLYYFNDKNLLQTIEEINLGYKSSINTYFNSTYNCSYLINSENTDDININFDYKNKLIQYNLNDNQYEEKKHFNILFTQAKTLNKFKVHITQHSKSDGEVLNIETLNRLNLRDFDSQSINVKIDTSNDNVDTTFDVYKKSINGNYILYLKNQNNYFTFNKSDCYGNKKFIYNELLIVSNFDNSKNTTIKIIEA